MGIFIIFSYLHIEKIYGLLRFGLLIEDDQLVYWVFHLYDVNDLYKMYKTVCVFVCVAYEGYRTHEVDISIVAGIIFFVKKRALFHALF